jgi:aryl-alcohol dehydrogenase-like predicted oxidoreductase
MGNVVWSPMAQGVLTGKYRSVDDIPPDSRGAGEVAGFMGRYLDEDVLDAVQGFVEVADRAEVTPAQLAIAWCLRRPEVSSAIAGATKPRHVEENVAAADLELDRGVFDQVDGALGWVEVEGV